MKRKHIILIHVLFWSVMLVSTGLQVIPSIGNTPWNIIAVDYFIYAATFVMFFYLFYCFVSERHQGKKKLVLLIVSGVVLVFVLTLPITYIYIYLLFPNILEWTGRKFLRNFGKYYISFFETNFIFALLGSLLKTVLAWYEVTMRQKETEKQLVSGELALLRSQINPRFLLNTLTYIKSLIVTQPDKAIYSIESLSEVMSYMLYETSAGKVQLDEEINYINNYLNLQRVRYSPDHIRFEVTSDTRGILVPPLMFMPLLESAFEFVECNAETPGILIFEQPG